MAQLDATQFPTDESETFLELDDLTGSVSTKVLTGSHWIKTSSGDAQVYAMSLNDAGLQALVLSMSAAGVVSVIGRDQAGIIRLQMTSDTSGYNDGAWHHVAFSFDLNTATQSAELYIDGASDMTTADVLSDVAIDFDTGLASTHRIGIGVLGPTRLPWKGCLTEYWLGWEHVDLSTDIGNFYSGGSAVPLGSDGSTPTGRQPEVFLSGGHASIETNNGSGENFAKVTGVTGWADCVDGPEIFGIVRDLLTRLGMYGGPRGLYGDFHPKGAVVEPPSGAGGGLKKGGKKRAKCWPRRIYIDGKLYTVRNAEEERELLRQYLDSLRAKAEVLEERDAPVEQVKKARIRVRRVARRIEKVATREEEWYRQLCEEDEEILMILH